MARAHELGLKVTIDQVYAHTSDLHGWFADSRASRTGDKADWYVWHDPRPDGTPPNNWQSVFGGPAWTWDARRGQYYMHQFLSSQPQLNAHNPAVQDALLGVMRFWLDRGVDGFRLDALNHSMHDPEFRDNPPAPDDGSPRTRPFDFQIKRYSQSHPNVVPFVERIRALCDEYGAIFTVAEVGGALAEQEMKAYTQGNNRLNSAYGFNFLYADALTPALVQETVERWPADPGMGWPSWAFENHDAPRALSRWCAPEDRTAFAALKAALLVALRGNAILYQGEELGVTQVDIPFDQLQDPEAIANWPLTLSRDGARTPLPWSIDEAQAGFSTGQPWLPHGEENLARAVDAQEGDPGSLLNLTRGMLALRKANGALRHGDLDILLADEARLVFRRRTDDQSLICVFNLSPNAAEWPQDIALTNRVLTAVNGAAPGTLPPYGALMIEE